MVVRNFLAQFTALSYENVFVFWGGVSLRPKTAGGAFVVNKPSCIYGYAMAHFVLPSHFAA